MQYTDDSLKEIFTHFQDQFSFEEEEEGGEGAESETVSIEPYGSGHIHDTYRVYHVKRKDHAYILQRINDNVFPYPEQVMENIVRVTKHLSQKIEKRGGDPVRETLTPISTTNDATRHFVRDDSGNYWRLYKYISETVTALEKVGNDSSMENVFEAAATIARFQNDLSDLPEHPPLHPTVAEGFADPAVRFRQFQEVLLQAKNNNETRISTRLSSCKEDVQFGLARQDDTVIFSNLLGNQAMKRVAVHHDPKLDNILLDKNTKKGLCIIDLDTTMPGSILYDFGDLVRSATATALEDEPDLSKVDFSISAFDKIVDGYLSEMASLTVIEIDHLAFAAKIVTFTIGLRFLTDHLAGDVYFKTSRKNHNLDRARTQFKMVALMEEQMDVMKAIVDKYRIKHQKKT